MPYEPIPFSTRSLLLEAEKYGVEWEEFPGARFIQLSYKEHQECFYTQVAASTTSLASYCTQNKSSTRNILQHSSVKVPNGFFLTTEDSTTVVEAAYTALKKPVVTKPFDANQGNGVTIDITSLADFKDALVVAFNSAVNSHKAALVEEMFIGKEYRVLATQEKVIGIIERVPANVIGDGYNTIKDLITIKNRDPRRGDDFILTPLKKIVVDTEVERILKKQQLTLTSVPKDKEQILLRKNSNLSTGGDSIDRTDEAHPDVKKISLKVMQSFPGLAWAGIDFMTSDILSAQTNDTYCIIEVNDSPGFDMHDFPYLGKSRHAAREFLFLMFPELSLLDESLQL